VADIHFAWDPAKARANVRKHGITFEEAETAFSDDFAIVVPDPDHSADEARFLLIGLSAALRVLLVVHSEQADGEVIRVISARRATRSERAQYDARWKR
jgi:uncharacterized DUF497 family protein